jgi:hypothetical protein
MFISNKYKAIITMAVFVLITALTVLFVDRRADANPSTQLQKGANSLVKKLTYIKDSRTGLCFAVYHVFRNSAITVVPCAKANREKNEIHAY